MKYELFKSKAIRLAGIVLLVSVVQQVFPQRAKERLNRGVVALATEAGEVFVSWRLLADDPMGLAFNIYRTDEQGTSEKLNETPLTGPTCYVDTQLHPRSNVIGYFVKPVIDGAEGEASSISQVDLNKPANYLTINLQPLPGYTAGDASVGDLDGNGDYEIVLHRTGRGRDNSHDGFTDPPVLEAYKLDGTFLWRIQLGKNIREGAHYTQFMVYDLDGDGKAEVACKTADGTIDGGGTVIGDSTKDWRNEQGRILDGPEFLTVFEGASGKALTTVDYIPGRDPIDGWGTPKHNDTRGNRSDRFLAAVAYLDGRLPSLVMCRGYYARSVIAAWDFRGGMLTSRWVFDSQDGRNPYSGQGFHNLSVADVDGDGNDEIVYGAMVVDHDGQPLYTTGWGHGDAQHLGELIPSRPGLEIFTVHEKPPAHRPGAALRDARTGEALWLGAFGQDVGRGVAANIDAANPGAELWFSGSDGLLNAEGERIGPQPSSANFLIWWDGDLTRELLDGITIDKYRHGPIFKAEGCVSINGTKSTPVLSADLFGDWREEVIFPTADHLSLRIYSTTLPTPHRLVTLMHDPQYRLSVAWQNVAYNQPPHTGFYIGEDMSLPPKPTVGLSGGARPSDPATDLPKRKR
ncbi:rhamnogalacturonan lyase [Parapedobacter deserti]|uniref:Rhamnogalacturonan lyase n=1 Tax=Parapedobacter deserti TaxID=1912957 RepID=A0ABV7JU98_9SPHI